MSTNDNYGFTTDKTGGKYCNHFECWAAQAAFHEGMHDEHKFSSVNELEKCDIEHLFDWHKMQYSKWAKNRLGDKSDIIRSKDAEIAKLRAEKAAIQAKFDALQMKSIEATKKVAPTPAEAVAAPVVAPKPTIKSTKIVADPRNHVPEFCDAIFKHDMTIGKCTLGVLYGHKFCVLHVEDHEGAVEAPKSKKVETA